MATIQHRARCEQCRAELVHLTGDPAVPYEDIVPSDGGPRTLIEHTDERCQFHQFLTPDPRNHVLPGNADWVTLRPVDQPRKPRFRRSVREDQD